MRVPGEGARTAGGVREERPVRVAYLVNQYPRTSHSFIRREILALEELGLEVRRFSLRPLDGELVSEVDRQELQRTRIVLSAGAPAMARAVLAAVSRPAALARALGQAVRLGWSSDRGLLRHLAYLVEACVLRRWLEEEGVQHLHAHFGTNPAAVALLCRTLGGPSYSFTVHGPQEFDRPAFLGLEEKVRHAAFAVGISSFGRSQVMRWTRHQDWPRIHVVHCGVPPELLGVALEAPPAARRLVCIARLAAAKGHLLLLSASARLLREGLDHEIVLAGDGPLRPVIEAEVARLGLQGTVRLAGWMSEAQVRQSLASARALVLPSFAEGLPVVVMEALALGRPVITSAIAGIPELVRGGETGWLVPAGSEEALVGAMRQALLADPGELARMGRRGAALVAEHHDVRREAGRLKELVEAAARGAGVAPGGR